MTVRRRSRALALVAAAAALSLLAGCGGSSSGGPPGTTTIGAVSNGAAKQATLTVPVVDAIRAELPPQVRDAGVIKVGLGQLPAGSPPLGYVGTDEKTLTGAEPDLARLVGAVLGVQVDITNATWENMFVGIDSGRTDIGFSNITVTEQRKQKYDFASYRKDNLAFEAPASSTWTFTGDPAVLAGKRVAVARGTNQERIVLAWQSQVRGLGENFDVEYYPDFNAAQLALDSGQVDTNVYPNPSVSYQVTQTANRPNAKRVAGTFSGAGTSLQGLIAATTKKDSGLAKPVADAIDHLIRTGQYQQWLAAWNLADEAVPTSEVNPPGLPPTDT